MQLVNNGTSVYSLESFFDISPFFLNDAGSFQPIAKALETCSASGTTGQKREGEENKPGSALGPSLQVQPEHVFYIWVLFKVLF